MLNSPQQFRAQWFAAGKHTSIHGFHQSVQRVHIRVLIAHTRAPDNEGVIANIQVESRIGAPLPVGCNVDDGHSAIDRVAEHDPKMVVGIEAEDRIARAHDRPAAKALKA